MRKVAAATALRPQCEKACSKHHGTASALDVRSLATRIRALSPRCCRGSMTCTVRMCVSCQKLSRESAMSSFCGYRALFRS
eukprot:3723670-Pleurochrysis_carterae.AAC.1